MKTFTALSNPIRVASLSIAMVMLGSLIPSVHADDGNDQLRPKLSKTQGSKDDENSASQISSSSVVASSSSQTLPNGKVVSQSLVTKTAAGNAEASGTAQGKARSMAARDNQNAKVNKASSSANARVRSRGEAVPRSDEPSTLADDRQSVTSNAASSTTTVNVNGIRVTRTVEATDGETVTRLDVSDKKQEVFVRENSDGAIEVRIRSRKKNADGSADEKVYTAADCDDLKQQSPDVARMLERYEKMIGKASASVSVTGAAANSSSGDRIGVDAIQLLKDQLNEMLKQNANNPQIQKMIRQMIQDVDKQ